MGATHARVSTFEVPPENVDLSIKIGVEQVLPQAHGLEGFQGAIVLADRANGKMVTLTLWASEESMRKSESRANQLREVGADETGEQIVSVERYEIATTDGVTL